MYNKQTLISENEMILGLAILLSMVFVTGIMIVIFSGDKIIKLCAQANSADKLNLNYY